MTYKKIAVTMSELEAMTPLQLAHHINSISPEPLAVLVALCEYLHNKRDVLIGFLKHIGMIRNDPGCGAECPGDQPPPPETPPEP